MKPWIQTVSGKAWDYAAPSADSVYILDIAESLAKQARYLGHTPGVLYSVAQHSVLVARCLAHWDAPVAVQLAGLMHDAAEAYVGDVPAPLKHNMGGSFAECELEATFAIERALSIDILGHKDATKRADMAVYAVEVRDLMAEPVRPFTFPEAPVDTLEIRHCWGWQLAMEKFLAAWNRLRSGRGLKPFSEGEI